MDHWRELSSAPERTPAQFSGELRQLSDRLLEILSLPQIAASLACAAQVSVAVRRLRNELALARRDNATRGLTRWQLQRVTRYMLERLDEPPSLDELGALLNLSRWHFCTAFRLASDMTPREWLIAQRIQKALQLLAQTSLSITEIALAVGYRSPSAFASQFRRHVGVAPLQFRRR
ncbi:MAG: AraC family transcriptional regulator [Steroidobacteraceae bacterium]